MREVYEHSLAHYNDQPIKYLHFLITSIPVI